MAKYSELEEEAQLFVKQFLLNELSPNHVFHNYSHTEGIVKVCMDFGEKAQLSKKELLHLLLAAWFCETGFARSHQSPWKESIHILTEFLLQKDWEKAQIEDATRIIHRAFITLKPKALTEKILYDAYWSYLGHKKLDRYSRLLRMEKEQTEGATYTGLEWHQYMLDLLLNTRFYTTWGMDEFASRKNRNVDKSQLEVTDAEKEYIRKKTGKDFGRGVDTVYRVTLQNHMNFSSIADGKANMIISINTVVLSAIITAISYGATLNASFFAELQLFSIPVIVLMLSSLAAIIFAVLSAIPKVSQNIFTKEDLESHKVSMLYFGNFLQLKKHEFVEYLRDLKEDQEILYDDLSKDLYSLGQVLLRKYRLLTLSYRVFIGGLIASVGALLVILLVG